MENGKKPAAVEVMSPLGGHYEKPTFGSSLICICYIKYLPPKRCLPPGVNESCRRGGLFLEPISCRGPSLYSYYNYRKQGFRARSCAIEHMGRPGRSFFLDPAAATKVLAATPMFNFFRRLVRGFRSGFATRGTGRRFFFFFLFFRKRGDTMVEAEGGLVLLNG